MTLSLQSVRRKTAITLATIAVILLTIGSPFNVVESSAVDNDNADLNRASRIGGSYGTCVFAFLVVAFAAYVEWYRKTDVYATIGRIAYPLMLATWVVMIIAHTAVLQRAFSTTSSFPATMVLPAIVWAVASAMLYYSCILRGTDEDVLRKRSLVFYTGIHSILTAGMFWLADEVASTQASMAVGVYAILLNAVQFFHTMHMYLSDPFVLQTLNMSSHGGFKIAEFLFHLSWARAVAFIVNASIILAKPLDSANGRRHRNNSRTFDAAALALSLLGILSAWLL